MPRNTKKLSHKNQPPKHRRINHTGKRDTKHTTPLKPRNRLNRFFASDKLSLLTDFLDEKTRSRLAATTKDLNRHSHRTTENYLYQELKSIVFSKELQEQKRVPLANEIHALIAPPMPTATKIQTLADILNAALPDYLDQEKEKLIQNGTIHDLSVPTQKLMNSQLLQKTLSPLNDSFKRLRKEITWKVTGFLYTIKPDTDPVKVITELNCYFHLGLTPNSGEFSSIFERTVKSGHPQAVALCIQEGADVHQIPEFGEPPVIIAAENGYAAIVKLLVDAKADVNYRYCHSSALDNACQQDAEYPASQQDYEKVLSALLTSDTLKKITLTLAMKAAVLHERHSMIRMLKQAGANCAPAIKLAKKEMTRFTNWEKSRNAEIARFQKIIDFLRVKEPRTKNKKPPARKRSQNEIAPMSESVQTVHESPSRITLPRNIFLYLMDFLDDTTRLRFAVTAKSLNTLAKETIQKYIWNELQSIALSSELQQQKEGFWRYNQPSIFFPGEAQVKAIIAQQFPIAIKIAELADILIEPMRCYLRQEAASWSWDLLKKPLVSIKKFMSSKLLRNAFPDLQDAFDEFEASSIEKAAGFLGGIKPDTDPAEVEHTLQCYFALGVTVDSTYREYYYLQSIFQLAVESGNAAAVSFCINKGLDVNHKVTRESRWDTLDDTALMTAAKSGHAHITRLLLANKADPNVKTDDHVPIITAAEKGDIATVTLLVAAKADVNRCCSKGDRSNALGEARGNKEVLEVLLTSDTLQKKSLDDPMHDAIFRKDFSTIRLLKSAGAHRGTAIKDAQRHIDRIHKRVASQDIRPGYRKMIAIMQDDEKPVHRRTKPR